MKGRTEWTTGQLDCEQTLNGWCSHFTIVIVLVQSKWSKSEMSVFMMIVRLVDDFARCIILWSTFLFANLTHLFGSLLFEEQNLFSLPPFGLFLPLFLPHVRSRVIDHLNYCLHYHYCLLCFPTSTLLTTVMNLFFFVYESVQCTSCPAFVYNVAAYINVSMEMVMLSVA